MSTALNPEIAALRDKVEEHARELAEMRGTVNQLNRIVSSSARQSIWQLIALIVSLSISIAGGLAYQANMIDKRLEQLERRIDLSERNFNARFEQLEKRIDLSEKNMSARFEDLKQEVRTRRK
jgi:hypothetical protein